MSAIADFRLIEASKLNELCNKAGIQTEKKFFSAKTIDPYWEFLNTHSTRLKDFNGSGYVFADLLIFLKEKKEIDLLQSKYDPIAEDLATKRESGLTILTHDHRQHYLEKLNPGHFTEKELVDFNKEFSEVDDPALAEAEMEGIKALHEHLQLLTDDTKVILLTIG